MYYKVGKLYYLHFSIGLCEKFTEKLHNDVRLDINRIFRTLKAFVIASSTNYYTLRHK